jgi:UDP-N-acetylmuramate: L-alanyl-gamma-D-glutamyl-meso-diaminopimelate ligase
MNEYKGVMEHADEAVVFYSKHALEMKRLPLLESSVVKQGFGQDDLQVFNKREDLETFLATHTYDNSIVLLMSSGNYDGLDVEAFSKQATANIQMA